MSQFLKKTSAILWKDILAELRTKEIIASVLIFALLVIITFNFAFDPENISLVASGILWVAFTFGGILGLNRSFVHEKDKGSLDGLLLSPVDREVIFLGKMMANLTFMLVVAAIVLSLFYILFDLAVFRLELVSVIILATIGFASVGTLFSAMAVNTRAREIMLPILFFPIASPVIIAAVKATQMVLDGESWNSLGSWFQLIGVFDIIFLVASALVFEFVIEE
ncbi:MAG: heme exporter protein CcmB [Chloroflexi bacterium]|nr:heme exporter protein CcmB [Chloroflexota bacterium]